MPGKKVIIAAGARTPYCKAGTAMKRVHAVELGRVAVVEALARAQVSPDQVDEIIVGNIAQPPDSANIARVIALRAGIPERVPAVTVCRNCASGLQSITDAADKIRAGEADIIVAAGVESMSGIPLLFHDQAKDIFEGLGRARSGFGRLMQAARFRPRHFKPVIALLKGLTDPVCGMIMGETAELLAREYGISRDEQDAYALRSHERAIAARERLASEIVPLYVPPKNRTVLTEDLGPRSNQTLEALGRLRPFFDRSNGTVTPGNSCMITDGAAAVVVMSAKAARNLDAPLGTLRSYAYVGLDPKRMGLGPVYATPKALAKADLTLKDIDLIELNEAFAAQVLACLAAFESKKFARDELGLDRAVGKIDQERLNVNGGAISLGHPVGSSGTRLVLTLLNEMARRDKKRGLATLCVGGGQGGALVLERD